MGANRVRVLFCDDGGQNLALSDAFRSCGCVIDHVNTGRELELCLSTGAFDLVILDLDRYSGWGVDKLARLRSCYPEIPVLALGTFRHLDDRMSVLEAGADDVVAKPFAFKEIQVRSRSLIRRAAGANALPIQLGRLSFDRVRRSLYLEGRGVILPAKELRVLEILLNRLGHWVTKQQLIDGMYALSDEVSGNVIEVYIHRVRKKIMPAGITISMSRGLGYRLESVVFNN